MDEILATMLAGRDAPMVRRRLLQLGLVQGGRGQRQQVCRRARCLVVALYARMLLQGGRAASVSFEDELETALASSAVRQ